MYAYVYIVPSFSTTLEFTRNVLLSAIVIRSTIGFFCMIVGIVQFQRAELQVKCVS